VSVTGIQIGSWVNTTSTVTSTNGGTGNAATATIVIESTDAYQIRYISNITGGDSFVNITNTGFLGADPFSGTTGRICANVYVFSPDEQEIACCSCLVPANSLKHLSAQALVSNTVTGAKPDSIVVKLLATVPGAGTVPGAISQSGPFTGDTCNPAFPFGMTNLVSGMLAWGTTLHALPGTPAQYGVTEDRFQTDFVSPGELAKLTNLCAFIQGNGSGAGICSGCQRAGQ
jgi:hypothetical protein